MENENEKESCELILGGIRVLKEIRKVVSEE